MARALPGAFPRSTGSREHLKRPAKVEDLNILEQDNANPLSCHVNLDADCAGRPIAGANDGGSVLELDDLLDSEGFGLPSEY